MRTQLISRWKRSFDVVVAALGLVAMTPVFALVALMIKLDSKGPVFFRQERIGRGFRPFSIYKFRTMVVDRDSEGHAQITTGEDPRVTRVGRLIRRLKIDELPQLINVLCGEMSLVGPRPEVSRYVELFRQDYEEILRVQPGITDLASIKYRDESSILSLVNDPEKEYVSRILPDKISLAKEYVERWSFFLDISLIMKTMVRILVRDKRQEAGAVRPDSARVDR